MNNADMPAMPLTGDAYRDFAGYDGTRNTSYNPECQGMTKREQFAMAAMQGMLANKYVQDFNGGESPNNPYALTIKAVAYADALLKALEESK